MSNKVPKMKHLFIILSLLALAVFLGGCEGDDGAPGADGADGVDGVSAPHTAESCNVCHGVGAIADVAEVHPMLEKPTVSDIVVSRSAGDVLTVTFTVTDADGDGIEGIIGPGDNGEGNADNVRVYMAAIVPAGTATVNVPQSTWPQDYLEMWAEERGLRSAPDGAVATDLGDGDYSFQMTPGALAGIGGADAPEAMITDKMRVYVRADARDLDGFNRTMGVADFDMPAAGGTTGVISTTTRTIVTQEACTQCHGDPLERAAHGGGYQSPQVCIMCHSPIGQDGDEMQAEGFWLANLIHAIHQESPDATTVDFSEVTYPRHPSDCGVCHFDAGQDLADAWKTPTVESCGTCHNSEGAQIHLAGVVNGTCTGCHNGNIAPSVTGAHEVTTLKNDPAHEGNVVSNVQTYTAALTLTPAPANGTHYVAGEEILVTVTTSNYAAGDYNVEGATRTANVYVYGPRANSVPILTPGSTTDPAFDPETMTPDQGRSMLIDNAAGDAQILTDADGFKYQLQAIPDDLAPGTYMVMAYVTTDVADCSAVYRGSVCIDGWVLTTFQIGTATEELKVAGDCSGCHDPQDWTTFFHRSYFGTDGCIACHDQSENHADFLPNRVHAVHAASATGDLLGAAWDGSDPEIHAPTFPRNTYACEACHDSGKTSYLADPVPVRWGAPCIGCHGDTSGARDHMIQNGSDFGDH